MKVLIIGCGAVGSAAATLLAKERDVDKVVIGDINLHNARQSVKAIQELSINAKIEAAQVDASDEASVAKAVRGSSLVYNGASSACNLPTLKACINTGANYMDTAAELPLPGVIDEANIANLMVLDSDAKAAGITAITCMGIGPGYTNIAVHYIINQMEDTAKRVRIKWFDLLEADDLIGTWTPTGLMGEFLGGPHPVIWQDGDLKPGKFLYSESHEFPEPVGERTVYTATFHPELWMLPNYLPDDRGKSIKYIDMMGGMDIGNLSMKDVWLTAIQRQAIKEKIERPLETGQDMIAAFGSSFKTFPNFKVVATTLRNAKTATKNDWGAVLYADGDFHDAVLREDLEILDRVGGGDSFASGLIYGLMEQKMPDEAVNYGAAHGALAMTTPGDTTTASLKEVERILKGGTARIDR